MDINHDKHVPKTKEEKEAFKAQKKLEKEMRKVKTLQKGDKNDLPSSSDVIVTANKEKIDKISQKSNSFQNVKGIQKPIIKIKGPLILSTTSEQKIVKKSEKHHWFNQLYQPIKRTEFIENTRLNLESEICPHFIQFALDIDSGKIKGSTSRCRLFLQATKQMVIDLPVDDNTSLSRKFTTLFDKHTDFINHCRPLSVTMRTAIKYLKSNSSIVTEVDNKECKTKIINMIDQFIEERIDVAQKTIEALLSKHLRSNISVLVYSYSELVFKSILYAWNDLDAQHKAKFSVFLVTSFPDNDSDLMMDCMKKHNIAFVQLQLSSVPQIMKQIDLVLLGVHSILSDNNIVGRCGSASIASIAKVNRKPVLVCAETYKFYCRGVTDRIEINELGCPDKMVAAMLGPNHKTGECDYVANWRKARLVRPLDLQYDIYSHRLVNMVCCELGPVSATTASFVTHIKEPVAS